MVFVDAVSMYAPSGTQIVVGPDLVDTMLQAGFTVVGEVEAPEVSVVEEPEATEAPEAEEHVAEEPETPKPAQTRSQAKKA